MKFLILALAMVGLALADQPPIAILRQAQDISPDGSYNHAYEAENGISVSESGAPGPLNEDGQPAVVAQGQFQYTAPDGSPISLTYTADEFGFHPQGDHLPVGPPVPALIQKALDFIAGHPPQSHGIPPVNAHASLAPPRKVPGRPNFPSQATRRF